METLSSENSYTRGTFSIQAAASRISQLQGQIDYMALEALGKYNQEWTSAGSISRFQKSTLPKVAIIDSLALAGEGNNAERLFNSFCCKVFYIKADELLSQNFDMYYFPDGLGYIAIDSFNSAKNFTALLKNVIVNKKMLFANGASGLVFGEKYIKPDGSEAKGLGILPIIGNYNTFSTFDSPVPVVCAPSRTSGVLLQGDEKINAYMTPNVSMESQSKSFRCSFATTGNNAGSTGYEDTNTIIAGVWIDLWSNPEAIRRLFL
jgi:hypothetical protein